MTLNPVPAHCAWWYSLLHQQLASRSLDFTGFWRLQESVKICFACGGQGGEVTVHVLAILLLANGGARAATDL